MGQTIGDMEFGGGRIIVFDEVKQSDAYLIEPTGRYTIEANSALLPIRIKRASIVGLAAAAASEMGDFWLLRPAGGGLPRLVFHRQLVLIRLKSNPR